MSLVLSLTPNTIGAETPILPMVKTALSEVFIVVLSGIGEVAGAGLMVGVMPREYRTSATKKRLFKTANIKTKPTTKTEKNLNFLNLMSC